MLWILIFKKSCKEFMPINSSFYFGKIKRFVILFFQVRLRQELSNFLCYTYAPLNHFIVLDLLYELWPLGFLPFPP